MMCERPIHIEGRGMVPCGACLPCLQNRRNAWTMRLQSERKDALTSYFVTLTYNEDNYPSDGKVVASDVQNYLKALRFAETGRGKSIIKYFCVAEYGDIRLRPHYHLIIFNVADIHNLVRCWKKGFVTVGTVTPASIHYVTKYCLDYEKYILESLPSKPFMLCSNGIGKNYLTPAMMDYFRKSLSTVAVLDGNRYNLPRYYRERLFDDEMKATIQDIRNLEQLDILLADYYGKNDGDINRVADDLSKPVYSKQIEIISGNIRRRKKSRGKKL